MPKPDLWALWPDDYMAPLSELDELCNPPCARSDDFQTVEVLSYDPSGLPDDWRPYVAPPSPAA
jgi:hypothetical protein